MASPLAIGGEELLLLLVGARRDDGLSPEAGGRHAETDSGVDRKEFLGDDGRLQRGVARAAVLGGNGCAEHAHLAGGLDEVVGVLLLPVVLARDGRDLVFGEAAHLVADLFLLVGQLVVHNRPLYSPAANSFVTKSKLVLSFRRRRTIRARSREFEGNAVETETLKARR